jgi:lysophospholipase L1-like esterase
MIYAIGDSFTFGDELESQEQAWPAVLSGRLNLPVVNQGRPATGNTRMVKRAVDAVIDHADMIIIGWSGVERQEFADEIGIYDLWAGRNFRAFQNDPTHRIDMIKYMTAYDTPEYYYARWLRQVILVQSLCKLNNVPCIMFVACGANESHRQYHKNFEQLVNKIDQSMFVGSMSNSVAEWCYGMPYGPNGHPLVKGHQQIAEKINEHIGNISRLS